MGKVSSAYKSWLETFYFQRKPEGLVFTMPPLWMFSRGRSYAVSEAQTEQLLERIYRNGITTIIITVVAIVLCAGVVATVTPRLFDHPFAAGLAIGLILIPVVALSVASLYRTVGSVLPGVAWTTAPRETWSSHFKKVGAGFMLPVKIFPTWFWILSCAVFAIALPFSMFDAYKAYASGRSGFELLTPMLYLFLLLESAAALVLKFKEKRLAK